MLCYRRPVNSMPCRTPTLSNLPPFGLIPIKYSRPPSRQQFAHRRFEPIAPQRNADHRKIPKFRHHLPAGAARTHRLPPAPNDRYSLKLPDSPGDGRPDRHSLRANRKTEGKVLNVASGVYLPSRPNRGPHSKPGIRRIGTLPHLQCGRNQRFQLRRHPSLSLYFSFTSWLLFAFKEFQIECTERIPIIPEN